MKEALKGICLQVQAGQSYALVGESGSGKSVTCSAILGLLPPNASVKGKIWFNQTDILQNPHKIKEIRGCKIGYIPQNPITSLNPVRCIRSQMEETLQTHKGRLSKAETQELIYKVMTDVQLLDYERILSSYPFELSGGMCQRVMIALALLGEPMLLLADEPTTALDVTIQAEIMSLLLQTTSQRNLALLLITHDLALVAQTCSQMSVIKDGIICETGSVAKIFKQPKHNYTTQLLKAVQLINI